TPKRARIHPHDFTKTLFSLWHSLRLRFVAEEAGHVPGCKFLVGVVHLHPPFHLLEGALDRRGPSLTLRLFIRDHANDLSAVTEVECVVASPRARDVFPKIAHRPADGHWLVAKAVWIRERS